jgi:putative heme-binding domain-containing protein
MGGRGSVGSIYRIVAVKPGSPKADEVTQPLAAWSKVRDQLPLKEGTKDAELIEQVKKLLGNEKAEQRAHAVWLLGVVGLPKNPQSEKLLMNSLTTALGDGPLVRRRACEAFIRLGIEPPVKELLPLLADKDQFVRTAARLVLQRIDPKKWASDLISSGPDLVAFEAIVSLCKEHRAQEFAEVIWKRLHDDTPDGSDLEEVLNYLRCIQLALIHTIDRGDPVRGIAAECIEMFPHADAKVNRELAILLSEFGRGKLLAADEVVEKLLIGLEKARDDKPQQIHYFYCLRLLKEGWKSAHKDKLTAWYNGTKSWTGGASFTRFLENIFRECLDAWTVEDRQRLLADGLTHPLPALVLAQKLQTDRQYELLPVVKELRSKVAQTKGVHREKELSNALGEVLARTALLKPDSPDNWNTLVESLTLDNATVVFDVVAALKKSPLKPKPENASAFRGAILAARKLDDKNRIKGIELLRHWSGDKQFGLPDTESMKELSAWAKWFAQSFPKEPALPITFEDKPAESKYKFDELLAFLEKDPAGQKGDVGKGKLVFEKGQCLKCHKYGAAGEGLGPDLTTLSKRFKRADVLEAMLQPSKVISDQYRSTTVVTKKGQTLTGLMALQGGTVVILQQDGTKVMLKEDDVAEKFASLVSVMPEKLLDTLTKEEIADLFAYLESEPAK